MFETLNTLSESEQCYILRVVSNLEILRIQGIEPSVEQIATDFNTLPEKIREIGLEIYANMMQKSSLYKVSKSLEKFYTRLVQSIMLNQEKGYTIKSITPDSGEKIFIYVPSRLKATYRSDKSTRTSEQLFAEQLSRNLSNLDVSSLLICLEVYEVGVTNFSPLDLITSEQKKKSTNSYSFLFNSVQSAQEVAYSLRGKWDQHNGVELRDYEYSALKLTTSIYNAEYCRVGDSCVILGPLTQLRTLTYQFSNFNFRTQDILPDDLRRGVIARGTFSYQGKDALDAQYSNTIFYLSPQSLRCHLVNNLGYKDFQRVISYYCYSHGRSVHYNFHTGKRLGDEIGVNDWFLKA